MYRVLCMLNSHESVYFLTKKATPGFAYKGGGSAEAVFVVPLFVFLWLWHGAPERGFVVAGVVVATWGKGIAAALEGARAFLDHTEAVSLVTSASRSCSSRRPSMTREAGT